LVKNTYTSTKVTITGSFTKESGDATQIQVYKGTYSDNGGELIPNDKVAFGTFPPGNFELSFEMALTSD
jgi:hypothetical protein